MKIFLNQVKTTKFLALFTALGLIISFTFSSGVNAQSTWPNKPIKMLLGYPPGGGSDIVARLIAKNLGDRLGHNVIVENHAGAGGIIAADMAAKSTPDGYTLFFVPSGHASIAALRRKNSTYDAVNDFTWISTVTTYPLAFTVAPESPFKSFDEFLLAAKKEPGKYTYSSVGVGTAMHIMAEWTFSEAKVDVVHVPFKGGTQPFQELLAGRVDLMIDTMTLTANLLKDKRVRLLAVTSPKGMSPIPGAATVADSLPGVQFESWLGVAAPANLPTEITARLNKEIIAVVNQPDVKQKLIDFGGKPQASSSVEFKTRVQRDIDSLSKVVDARGITAN